MIRNKLYLVAQLLHDFDVERLESVSVRVDEVEAAMHAVIHDVLPVKTALIAKVPEQKTKLFLIKPIVNCFIPHDRLIEH